MPLPPIEDLLSYALEDGALFGGGILKTDLLCAQWLVTTPVPEHVFALLQGDPADEVITSDVIGIGEWTCWVLAFQVRDVQHRIFMPLLGTQVRELVQSVRASGLRLWMNAGDEPLNRVVAVSADLRRALLQHQTHWPEPRKVAELLFRTSLQLLLPPNLRPATGSLRPTTVSLTAVLASDFPLSDELGASPVFRALRGS